MERERDREREELVYIESEQCIERVRIGDLVTNASTRTMEILAVK